MDLDDKFIEDFYIKNYNKLIYYSKRIGANDSSEDMVQETFLKALSKRKEFQGNSENFSSWIYTILKNNIISYLRRESKNVAFENIPLPKEENNIEDILTNKEVLNNIFYPKKRTFGDLLLKKFSEGWKYRELAKKYNLPIGSVQFKIFKSRKKFQEKFQKEFE